MSEDLARVGVESAGRSSAPMGRPVAPTQHPSSVDGCADPSPSHFTDPFQRYYGPLIAEFTATLIYTLFSNLLGIIGVGDSAAKLSVALFDGALNYVLICMFASITEGHFNPAITLASLLTLNLRLLFAISLIFVQFFGAFFGALLTKALLNDSAFNDAFVSLGLLQQDAIFGGGSVLKLVANGESDATRPLHLFSHAGMLAESGDVKTNRFQVFLLEMVLSTLLITAYLLSSTYYHSVLVTASSVASVRALISLIALITVGQGCNLARHLANNVVSSIFLMDGRVWRYFYIYLFADISSSLIGAGIYRIGNLANSICIHFDTRSLYFRVVKSVSVDQADTAKATDRYKNH